MEQVTHPESTTATSTEEMHVDLKSRLLFLITLSFEIKKKEKKKVKNDLASLKKPSPS